MRPQNGQTHVRNLATNVQDFKLVSDCLWTPGIIGMNCFLYIKRSIDCHFILTNTILKSEADPCMCLKEKLFQKFFGKFLGRNSGRSVSCDVFLRILQKIL